MWKGREGAVEGRPEGHHQNGKEPTGDEERNGAQIGGRGHSWPHRGQVYPTAVTRVGLLCGKSNTARPELAAGGALGGNSFLWLQTPSITCRDLFA